MQSHLRQVLTLSQNDTRPRWGRGLGSVRSCGLAREDLVLLGPVQRQIEFSQPCRGELDGLPALQDRLDQLRAQEGETNEAANVAPGKGAAGGELLKPCAPPRNRLDQSRVTSRVVLLLRQSGQNQFGFGTAPRDGDCRRQLDSVVTSICRCG